jgi:signal transduction histidine kinase
MDSEDKAQPDLLDLMALMRANRETERTRIARQLHDEVGQKLAAFRMACFTIGSRLSGNDRETAESCRATLLSVGEELQAALPLLDEAVSAVRELSEDLWPGLLRFGIGAAVEWQAARFQTRSEMACVADVDIDREPDAGNSVQLFRIFEDALANIALHVDTTLVEVILQRQGDDVSLVVRDDGKPPHAGESMAHDLGVLTMKERAERAGGVFAVSTSSIEVRLPLEADRSAPVSSASLPAVPLIR